MLKVVFFTGDQPRHSFLAKQLYANSILCGVIRENREHFVPQAPAGLSEHLTNLFNHHFAKREQTENEFFQDGWHDFPKDIPLLKIDQTETNSPQVVEFLQRMQPDLVLSYGCHIISKATRDSIPNAKFYNFHGGLSPYYRGVATHFWPSYFLEPQLTGITVHEVSDSIDGGGILLQTTYNPHKEDSLHGTCCRVVQDSAILVASRLANLQAGSLPQGVVQKSSGKLFLSSDWRPEHLRVIYDFYDDAIPALVLSGEIKGKVLTDVIDVLK